MQTSEPYAPYNTEAFRAYSWQKMLAAAGTYDKPELDSMGRAKDHGQKGVRSEKQTHRYNENMARDNKPGMTHPFKNYQFTNHI